MSKENCNLEHHLPLSPEDVEELEKEGYDLTFRVGDISCKPWLNRIVRTTDGSTSLYPQEMTVFLQLASIPQVTHTPKEIKLSLGEESTLSIEDIKVLICLVNKKIGQHKKKYIKNKRNVGYYFDFETLEPSAES